MARTGHYSQMNSQRLKLETGVMIYDADLFSPANLLPDRDWFCPSWWDGQGLVGARRSGRGTALMIKTPVGRAFLRQYLRGGWPSNFIKSRYLFTGFNRSRPMREFRVLEKLTNLGLPAPKPIAAWSERHLLTCTGAIITHEIENVRPLEQVAAELDESAWRFVGSTIRQFHEHGLVHADLNVRNILIQGGGKVFLVDFDRARFRANARQAFRANLKRLRRSMVKSRRDQYEGMNEKAWKQLLKGYES